MKKRSMLALATGALVLTMIPGVAVAAPDPDSAAGRCGGFNPATSGIGDSTGWTVQTLKLIGDGLGLTLGETIQALTPTGFGTPGFCAKG